MVEQLKNGNTKINDMSKKEPWGFCETPEEKCTMNYCDENGCQNRKRHLVDGNIESADFIIGDFDNEEDKK